jgi:hypothetical protein
MIEEKRILAIQPRYAFIVSLVISSPVLIQLEPTFNALPIR